MNSAQLEQLTPGTRIQITSDDERRQLATDWKFELWTEDRIGHVSPEVRQALEEAKRGRIYFLQRCDRYDPETGQRTPGNYLYTTLFDPTGPLPTQIFGGNPHFRIHHEDAEIAEDFDAQIRHN